MSEKVNLSEFGWEEPTEESPVKAPSNWQGGEVTHTGGNILNRVWYYEGEDIRYEVGYDDSFQGAQLTKYEYNEELDNWEFAGNLAQLDSDEQTDTSCAEAAIELMQEVEELDSI
jgi:hypothetical protein